MEVCNNTKITKSCVSIRHHFVPFGDELDWTLENCINLGSRYLATSGSESPKLNDLSQLKSNLASNSHENFLCSQNCDEQLSVPVSPATAFNLTTFRSTTGLAAVAAAHGFPFTTQTKGESESSKANILSFETDFTTHHHANHLHQPVQHYRSHVNLNNSVVSCSSVNVSPQENICNQINLYSSIHCNTPNVEYTNNSETNKINKKNSNYNISYAHKIDPHKTSQNVDYKCHTYSVVRGYLKETSTHKVSQSSPALSNSPDQKSRRYDNNSPVDSSKSYSFSRRSSEETLAEQSPHTESIGSQSPENLSSKNLMRSKIVPDMLDQKLPLSFLGPPLAALHSMTEMKSQGGSLTLNGDGSSTLTSVGLSSHGTSVNLLGHGQTSTTISHGHGNPHGIDTILSRPPPVTPAGLNALSGGGIPRFSIAAAAAGMAQYFSQGHGTSLKTHSAHIVDRPHLYWPGLQGLVANPIAWRERLTNSMSSNLTQSHHGSDKEGKKKHTRPTFSGQQIFALEKTFEQTKYLAGPERAKLAYALGMTESQVKVWFQNRRTKWRKKHAAEMATAKRKQEELGDGDGDCSETVDSDSESLDLGDSSRKRYRPEDEIRQ